MEEVINRVFVVSLGRRRKMGGMKDEAKRITIPPLFPRVHLNDTGRDGKKSMSLRKRSSLPSPTNKISDSSSTLSLSLPPPANNACIVSSLLLNFPFQSLGS